MRLAALVPLLTLVVAFSLTHAHTVHATSCMLPTPELGEEHSDVVFEAVAKGDAKPNLAKLEVVKVYKGEVPKEVEARYGGMKGYASFETGKRYLVFGLLRDQLFVHLCGATHELPAKGVFTQGPWKGWSVETQYGPGKPPGSALVAAPKASTTEAPAPPPSASAEPVVPPVTPGPGPAPAPSADAPPSDPPSGGCAGCAVSPRGSSLPAWLWLLAVCGLVHRACED